METPTTYSRREGVELLDRLLADGKRIFTIEDAASVATQLAIPRSTLHWALYELTRSGWVRRPRRGLYLVDETHRGGAAPHPFAVATALVEPSAISHWSALAHHGLTEQVPRIVTATTTRDLVTPRMRRGRRAGDKADREDHPHGGADDGQPASVWEVDGLAVRYFRMRPEHFWGHEKVWVDEFSRVPITDRERTVLDGFINPRAFGSLQEVVGALEEHLADIDVPRLAGYALRYGRGATIKRLGYMLEQLGATAEAIRPLLEAPIHGYRLLDPQGPDQGARFARWHIRDNVAT